MSRKTATLSVLLGLVALIGLSWAVQVVAWAIVVDDFAWDSAAGRRLMIAFPVCLLVGGSALWGLMRLKPWGDPISPRTRKSYTRIALAALVLIPAASVLSISAFSRENMYGIYSDSALSPGITIYAIASWLVAVTIMGWAGLGTDEHERRANELGLIAIGAIFMTVTPAWWLAARADLLPQPNAIVLWFATVPAMAIVWLWYHFR
jgi:hypothetical protein